MMGDGTLSVLETSFVQSRLNELTHLSLIYRDCPDVDLFVTTTGAGNIQATLYLGADQRTVIDEYPEFRVLDKEFALASWAVDTEAKKRKLFHDLTHCIAKINLLIEKHRMKGRPKSEPLRLS